MSDQPPPMPANPGAPTREQPRWPTVNGLTLTQFTEQVEALAAAEGAMPKGTLYGDESTWEEAWREGGTPLEAWEVEKSYWDDAP